MDGTLTAVGTTEVETDGEVTALPGLPDADLHLVNAGDLTFAAARTDAGSLPHLLDAAGALPDPLSRAVALTTAWDMLVKGELSSGQTFDALVGALATERSPALVEGLLHLAHDVAESWSSPADVPGRLERVAAVAGSLAEDPEHRAAALRTLAASTTDATDPRLVEAAEEDPDLAWRVLVRRAELGDHDQAAVVALEARDPDPDAWFSALAVTAARPDAAGKAAAWAEVFEKRTVPAGTPLGVVANAFWRPEQAELLLPYAHRYVDEVAQLGGGAMLAVGGLMRRMFPLVGDQEVLDRARALAGREDTDPSVRSTLLTGVDRLARMLRARES